MKKSKIITGLIMLTALITSCNKETANPATSGAYPYSVRMTDAPALYDQVNIDVQGVVVTGSDGQTVSLNTHQGIYNLLDFTNGNETTIASGTLADANVEQVRLILGSNNSVVVNGVSYPLSTPSAEQSGLKLQVHQTLEAGTSSSVLLDFDASKSIVAEGNGTFTLKPVIRSVDASISGSVSGSISPSSTIALVTATSISTNATFNSFSRGTGHFMIMGVPSGEYTVTITPLFPLNLSAVTENNIKVTAGSTTDIGTVIF